MKKRWLFLGLTILVLLAVSFSLSARPVGPGGPWRNATLSNECSNHGLVCAEWPLQDGGAIYCCVEAINLGSSSYGACEIYLGERDPDGAML